MGSLFKEAYSPSKQTNNFAPLTLILPWI